MVCVVLKQYLGYALFSLGKFGVAHFFREFAKHFG